MSVNKPSTELQLAATKSKVRIEVTLQSASAGIKQEYEASCNPLIDSKPKMKLRLAASANGDLIFPIKEEGSVSAPLIGSYTRKLRSASCDRNVLLSKEQVRKAHAEISKIWPQRANFPSIDPVQSALLAHEYYELHAPKGKIKLMLIAESHASTHASINGAQCITSPDGLPCVPKHAGHLNLVHCLTYGETHALDLGGRDDAGPDGILKSAHMGTYKFWRMLATCAGMVDLPQPGADDSYNNPTDGPLDDLHPFRAIEKKSHKYTKDADKLREAALERIGKKAEILQKLAERGIILVDLSPVPIYVGGGGNVEICYNKKSGKRYTSKKHNLTTPEKHAILGAAWEHYASKVIEKCQPENVVILGKCVMDSIGDDSILKVCLQKNPVGNSLGYLYHPSANELCARNHADVNLRFLREVCEQVARSPEGETCELPERLAAEPIRKEIRRLVSEKKLLKRAADAAIKAAAGSNTIQEESIKVTSKGNMKRRRQT